MYLSDTYCITQQPTENVMEHYTKAKLWLESIGININPSRFNQYYKKISSQGSAVSLKEAFQILWMHAELDDVCEIHKYLSHVSSLSFLQNLRLAIKGPLLLEDESVVASANKGRNYTFELYCAARLARAGIDISFDSVSDITFHLDDLDFHVECKRVFDEQRLDSLVIEAISQIDKRCSGNAFAKGIVAISISKIVYKAIGMSARGAHADLDEMQIVMRDLVGKWGILLRRHFTRCSLNTVGILLHYKMPFIDRSTGAIAFLKRFSMTPLDSVPGNLELARKVSRLLRQSVE